MNDRYLYRAKRTDNGEWVEGYLIYAKKDCYICENPYFFGEAVDACDCEVIGNIFDNPELLEVRE